jgi:hypothetical protein
VTGVPLWVAEPAGRCRLVLRRFCWGGMNGHRHDASVVIGEDEPVTPRGGYDRKPVPHDDPRWPEACPCGERFAASDEWQVNELEWHEGSGGRFCWGTGCWDGPPGAMIRSPWRDVPGRPESWLVFLPNGAPWNTNDRAGGYWQVTGAAPLITVHPSIEDPDPARPWHGWIRAGILEDAG